MRLAAVATALFGLALVAQPVLANEEAYAFIEGVYATYEEGDGHGIPLEGPTLRDHFTEELALLIEEDAKLGEQKRMNYDPLADAEEWEISDIRITIRELTYDHVLAAVNFYSYVEARLVNVDLVKTRNGWRIDDIQVPDGRLRELFSDDPEADDEDEVAVDGGPVTTESASEKRAATMTAPATPPVHFSGKPVPLPRPAPVRAEPAMPAVVEPATLEPVVPAAPDGPVGDFPLETASAPLDAPAATPDSPVETPAVAVPAAPVPEAAAPADTPAAVPAGPATEPANPADATPPKPEIPAIVKPDPAPKPAAKEKEKPSKKAVAPKKGKPKEAARPKAPPPAAAPPPPPAAEKPPVPPASGAPRFSTTRNPPPPAAKPAKPPVQAATEKAAPKGAANKPRESLP